MRPRPTAPQGRSSPGRPARLPWWGLALPALAFGLLLALLLGGGTADAAARQSAVGPPVVRLLLERIGQALGGA